MNRDKSSSKSESSAFNSHSYKYTLRYGFLSVFSYQRTRFNLDKKTKKTRTIRKENRLLLSDPIVFCVCSSRGFFGIISIILFAFVLQFSIFLQSKLHYVCVATKFFSFLSIADVMPAIAAKVQGIQHLRAFFCSRNCNNPNCFGYICNRSQLIEFFSNIL